MPSMTGPKHQLILEIEETYPFNNGTKVNHDRVWEWWEKLIEDGHLRQIDLIRLRGLLDAVGDVYAEEWDGG